MSVRDEFDEFAQDGRDREMESEHWPTARKMLSRMPVEPGRGSARPRDGERLRRQSPL